MSTDQYGSLSDFSPEDQECIRIMEILFLDPPKLSEMVNRAVLEEMLLPLLIQPVEGMETTPMGKCAFCRSVLFS